MLLPSLLAPNNLKNLLKTSSSFYDKFRIIETNLGDSFREHYKNGHIDKAVYLNTMECSESSNLYPRNIPRPECFKDYVGSLGISNKHHLILYDRSPFGFYTSSRMWWLFRYFGHEQISILDGGLRLWMYHNNNELSIEMPDFKKEMFEIKIRKELIRDYEDVTRNINEKKEQLVDVRGEVEFNRVDEDNNLNKIPESFNLPYNDFFDNENGKLKDKQEILELFKKSNVDLKKPIIASCMTGMTACTLAFAANLVGKPNVPVYYGSWTEYSQRRNN